MTDLNVGDSFEIYNRRCSARGVITKINRVNVIYDAPYFVTSTSPDGWLRGLKLAKEEFEYDGVRISRPSEAEVAK
jgi:hypothetical protein